jgi:HK97 family phage portal protein
MGWFDRFRRKSNAAPQMQAALDEHSGRGLIPTVMRSVMSVAGVPVTADSALTFASVFACVRVLAESVSSLPLILYRRGPDRGKDRATDHPLYSILHDAANDDTTSQQLFESIMVNTLLWGNGCAQIVPAANGSVGELWPLLSKYLQISRKDGELIYDYSEPGRARVFQRWEIFHVPGLTLNGATGLSVLGYWRRAIGLGLVLDSFSEAFYEHGANPGVVIEHPGVLSPEAKENIINSWIEHHAGVENANRPEVLQEGMKLNTYGMPLEDAQFIELKKFQAIEVARLFRVQPHKIGILDNASFSNIEHQGLEFVTDSLRPWLVRIEKRTSLDLLLKQERRDYFAEFLVDALLRGDLLSRYQAYAIGRTWGWLNADDIREKENMNPLPNGQGSKYLTPLNMTPSAFDETPQPQSAHEPAPRSLDEVLSGNGRH